ncbi:MAG: glycosyltransferase [Acidobacteriota bacterium]|nr:glycosyltransferase [Acidobacteriota bacterium]
MILSFAAGLHAGGDFFWSQLVLIVWLLTLGRTIVNLLLVPRLRHRTPRATPLLSVIIPARDEERTIERTVRAMLAQSYPTLELIVVNDRSTDATAAILASIDDPRLIVVNGVEPPYGWLGKPHALHLGASHAKGELLLFVDADVIYAPHAVEAAVAHIEGRDVALLTLFPCFEMRGFWEHVVMPNLSTFAFSFLPIWLTNRSRFRLLAIGGGTGNLVTREAYEKSGGHTALADAVIDDVGLARLMRRSGRRTEIVRADDDVHVRMYHGLREIVEGFTKNAFVAFNRSYLVALLFLPVAVAVHILPYVLALFGNPYAIAIVAVIALTRLILFTSLRYGVINALFAHPLMIGVWCWIMLRSIWYTGIRRQVHWRGRTYDSEKTKFGAD